MNNERIAEMKSRIPAFILSALLILCTLAACGGNNQVKDIQKRGVLRVGVKVDVPRFGYLNPDTGEMEGIEVDLARAIAKDIIGDENAVKFTNITAQTRGAMLDNGEIDIVIATFTITDERKETFSFSRPYYTDELGFLVRSDSSVMRPEDLDGKYIGVLQTSTAKDALETECASIGVSASMREYTSYPEVKAALISGVVDAFVTDKSILFGYLDEDCELLDYGFNPQNYGIACKLGNNKLAARIDTLVGSLENNGGLADIIAKWGL